MPTTKKKVLVIDDEDDVLQLIGASFKDSNVETELISRSALADTRIQWQKYDAIITDLRMAPLDGEAVVRNVRRSSLNRKTPVFVISGYLEREVVLRFLRLGIQGALVKPFRNQELVRMVMAAIGGEPAKEPATNE
jgi:DNA-binding response OmpR family regulator